MSGRWLRSVHWMSVLSMRLAEASIQRLQLRAQRHTVIIPGYCRAPLHDYGAIGEPVTNVHATAPLSLPTTASPCPWY